MLQTIFYISSGSSTGGFCENRQVVIRASLNKPSDANVCLVMCHNTAFIFVTYDPQITHDKQIGKVLSFHVQTALQ